MTNIKFEKLLFYIISKISIINYYEIYTNLTFYLKIKEYLMVFQKKFLTKPLFISSLILCTALLGCNERERIATTKSRDSNVKPAVFGAFYGINNNIEINSTNKILITPTVSDGPATNFSISSDEIALLSNYGLKFDTATGTINGSTPLITKTETLKLSSIKTTKDKGDPVDLGLVTITLKPITECPTDPLNANNNIWPITVQKFKNADKLHDVSFTIVTTTESTSYVLSCGYSTGYALVYYPSKVITLIQNQTSNWENSDQNPKYCIVNSNNTCSFMLQP